MADLPADQASKSPMPRLTWANGNDLWQIMRGKDAQFAHDHLYLRRHLGIEQQMRAVLLDWLAEIAYAYRLHRETLHLAVEYLDRFMSECKQEMKVDRLQLIGMTSLFLAAKVEEIYPPKLKELASHMENYSNNNEEAISQFELFMLKTLSWQISPVTSNTWLMTYLQIAAINYHAFLSGGGQLAERHREHNTHIVMPLNVYKNCSSNPSQLISGKQQEFYMKNYMKCITLLDLCLFDMDSMRFRYSMLAASAMYHMLAKASACAQNAAGLVAGLVQMCSGYAIGELDACVRWMAPYADVCMEVLGDDKMTAVKQFSGVDADDAHNIQLYYPNLDLLKEAQIRKTPSKFCPNNLTNSNILTPPESNRKNHQSGVA
ncbi:G1 S-specific cyclin-E1 [Brachionus plicatilis]|uniref:G1 S-specific cyclin-E1 n=1 Tax=Brachionus plicatilis TaxID=10195 RepID=A0A3M7S367_BRAPC|nr:G1 S-specific cyclin-E1 [Brachionus plicatilis]